MVRRKLVRRKYRGINSVRDARKTPESIRMEMRIRGVTMVRIHGIEVQSVAKAFGVYSSCVSRWLARYNNKGRLLNPNFTDYKIPTCKDIPGEIVPIIVEVPQLDGPFGARGVGEHTMPVTAEKVALAMLAQKEKAAQ